jgi:hypothetical protein
LLLVVFDELVPEEVEVELLEILLEELVVSESLSLLRK